MTLADLFIKIKNRIIWQYYLTKDYFLSKILLTPKILSTEETIKLVRENKMSITRFGDGEIGLMYGRDLNFQEYNPTLAAKMEKAIRSNNSKLLICIPDIFTKSSRKSLSLCKVDDNFWKAHLLRYRWQWVKRIKRSRLYGNSLLSRIYSVNWDIDKGKGTFSLLEDLWRDRDIVILEGAYSRLGVGNNCFSAAKSIRRILAPATNSFTRYSEVFNSAISIGGNPLFILALGPTATAMASELADAGAQALDLGHLDVEYEWMRSGCTSKEPVRGKYVNEAYLSGKSASAVSEELSVSELQLYKSQIIADFSK